MMQHQIGPNYAAGTTGAYATGIALCHAQAYADQHDTPVGIWMRDGWLAVSDVAPDSDDDDREADGWEVVAVVDPADAL